MFQALFFFFFFFWSIESDLSVLFCSVNFHFLHSSLYLQKFNFGLLYIFYVSTSQAALPLPSWIEFGYNDILMLLSFDTIICIISMSISIDFSPFVVLSYFPAPLHACNCLLDRRHCGLAECFVFFLSTLDFLSYLETA